MHDEFTQITRASVKDTVFQYKTILNTLTEDLFVKISAEDNRFNASGFSEIIKVSRPDTIRPSAPVFSNYTVSDSCIFLEWKKSSSKDVVNHIIFRTPAGGSLWTAIAVFDTIYNPSSYCDTSAKAGEVYDYVIIAVDDAGNKSLKGRTIQIQMADKKPSDDIKKFKGTINQENGVIELSWEIPSKPVYSILIYRKAGDDILRKYKILYQSVDKFTDKDLQINTRYEYQIRFIYSDKSSSSFSKKVILNY
jgi:hypothetical protein